MEVKGYTWPVAEMKKKHRSPVIQRSWLLGGIEGSTTNHHVSSEKKTGCWGHNLGLYIYIYTTQLCGGYDKPRSPDPYEKNGIMESFCRFSFRGSGEVVGFKSLRGTHPISSHPIQTTRWIEVVINSSMSFYSKPQSIPSRELRYPPKIAFWRWFSFSQGGIC